MKKTVRKALGLAALAVIILCFLLSLLKSREPADLEGTPSPSSSVSPVPTNRIVPVPTPLESATPVPPPTVDVDPSSATDIIPSNDPGPSTMTDILEG